ncbi:hypothetical protein ACFX43_23950 [Nocardioides sp. YIM B13467]
MTLPVGQEGFVGLMGRIAGRLTLVEPPSRWSSRRSRYATE